MNFYEIKTLAGRFWVEAKQASDAFRLAKAILDHDEFSLTRDDDVRWAS